MLTAVPITTDSKDFKEIKHLYIAAFPKSERVPLGICYAMTARVNSSLVTMAKHFAAFTPR